MTPTAQLLGELLPLLTNYCLTTVQQQCQHRQQLLQALQQQRQEGVQPADAPASSVRAPSAVVSTLEGIASTGCPSSARQCMMQLCMLLACSTVPALKLTEAEVPPAVQGSASAATSNHAQPLETGTANSRVLKLRAQGAACVPQACAGEVLHLCEALLRDTAAFRE